MQESPSQDTSEFSPRTNDIDLVSVANFLGVLPLENLDERNRMMLETVVEWARGQGSEQRGDVLWSVRTLLDRLGAPAIGTNRLSHLYNWVRLDMEEEATRREKKLYER